MDEKLSNIESIYPLSPMQQGMLFHSLAAPDAGVYFEQVICTLKGDLDVDAFQRAWQGIVERHAVLRTAFIVSSAKEPVQVVHRPVPTSVAVQDWQGISEAEQETKLTNYLRDQRRRGFKLDDPPLMDLSLLKTGPDNHRFIWGYHHLLLDGWSMPLVFKELLMLYEAVRRNRSLRLPAVPPYRDYIVWLKKQDPLEAERFWRQTLQGFAAPTPLMTGFQAESAESKWSDATSAEAEIWLDQELTESLLATARRYGLTVNTLVQGAWALLLSHYSGENDVLFGVTVSGRPAVLEGVEQMVGLFINTLPLRIRIEPQVPAVNFLKNLQSYTLEMRQFEYSSLIDIQGYSDVPRGTPLFESILVFENYPAAETVSDRHSSLQVEDIRSTEQTNYPLNLIAGLDERLMLKILYDSRIFDAQTVERMFGHLRNTFSAFESSAERPLGNLTMLDDSEIQDLFVEWNRTDTEYCLDYCVHELIEMQAAQRPDAIALVFDEDAISYAELNRRANQVAHSLRQQGVGPEARVGVLLEHSIHLVVGILGVLKAGGVYVPLDPDYPTQRLAYMIEDSGISVLLTRQALLDTLPDTVHRAPCTVLCLDTDWPSISRHSDQNLQSGATPDNLAYVIYTSGSTGKPKGTQAPHRGVVNLVHTLMDLFDITPDSRVLQFASICFDASVSEIFPSLAAGARLYLASRSTLMSSAELLKLLKDDEITIVTLPPSLLSVLPEQELPALKTVVSAGEACKWDIVNRWASGRRFLNGYGPTETTVAASYHHARPTADPPTERVPIGRPLPNTKLYVLDRHQQPVAVGVPGELYVGGVSLTRGYHLRPEMTAEKFIPDLFGIEPGGRLYRTGDRVRYLPTGEVEFLSRIDHQVKVRGFRIEPGDIEAALETHPSVKQAVVIARRNKTGDNRLLAYVTVNDHSQPSQREWRQYLKERLPDYMIPAIVSTMEAFPSTSSGKIDRRALPDPEQTAIWEDRQLVKPRNDIEARLTQIWEGLIDVAPISVTDNFFELGGHSLLVMRLLAKVQKEFAREISLADFFQAPTIESLAAALQEQTDPASNCLIPLQSKGDTPPLFLIHPSGGSVHWYTDLARELGRIANPPQRVYGLQARGLNGDEPLQTDVAEMAAHYVEVLRAFQPNGPYHLGSWSMGVVIAFEMAVKLNDLGQRVGLLALLDQGPVLPADEPEDDAAYLAEVFGKHVPLSIERLRELTIEGQLAHVWEQARKVKWIYPDVSLEQFKRFVSILRIHTEAWRHYEPKRYSGHITLFRAKDEPHTKDKEIDMGWNALADGGVTVHTVPGDHLNMLQLPRVRILADKMNACLHAQTA